MNISVQEIEDEHYEGNVPQESDAIPSTHNKGASAKSTDRKKRSKWVPLITLSLTSLTWRRQQWTVMMILGSYFSWACFLLCMQWRMFTCENSENSFCMLWTLFWRSLPATHTRILSAPWTCRVLMHILATQWTHLLHMQILAAQWTLHLLMKSLTTFLTHIMCKDVTQRTLAITVLSNTYVDAYYGY